MSLNWYHDIGSLPPQTLLLLDDCQLDWIGTSALREEFGVIFRAHPDIGWYFAKKRPALAEWAEDVKKLPSDLPLEVATERVLKSMEDWIVYAVDPDIYHNQPFVSWDERELTGLTDWSGKRVVDIGSGTGKQAFAVARLCASVYCVEPVLNLRKYLIERAAREGLSNLHVLDGRIERIPFEDGFADVVMGGHVYGDDPEREMTEMERVAKDGGMVILIPGGNDRDTPEHAFLVQRGYTWARFEEPGDGIKRKYWKTKRS